MATGHGTKNTVRNQELYDDWKSGKYTVVELVAKYRISSARIYAIVKRMKNTPRVVEFDIDKCPDCGSEKLRIDNDVVICMGCGSTFTLK